MTTELRLSILLLIFFPINFVLAQCPGSLNNNNGSGELTLLYDGSAPDNMNEIDTDFTGAQFNEVNVLLIGNSWQTTEEDFTDITLTGEITIHYTDNSSEVCAYINGEFNDPLPVELMDFSGIVEQEDIILSWSTAFERDNAGFEIERSFDGTLFEVIGMRGGAGNSAEVKDYSYHDEGLLHRALNDQVYYRLAQFDFDGQKNYSEILVLDLGFDFEQFEITKITGWNNSERMIQVYFYNPHDVRKINWLLCDLNGQLIEKNSIYPEEGLNMFEIDITAFESQLYFLSLNNGKQIIGKKIVLATDY